MKQLSLSKGELLQLMELVRCAGAELGPWHMKLRSCPAHGACQVWELSLDPGIYRALEGYSHHVLWSSCQMAFMTIPPPPCKFTGPGISCVFVGVCLNSPCQTDEEILVFTNWQ